MSVALLAVALASTGCGALLGVEDVTGDDGGGGAGGLDDGADGGGDVGPGRMAAGAGGAGSSATAGGGGAATSTGGATSTASTGAGACVQDRPPCGGVVPTTFDDPSALAGAWSTEAPRVKVSGKKLELDPDDDDGAAASVRTVAPVDPTGSCAVWIRREDGDDGETRLALLDAGGAERVALARDASRVVALVDEVEVASVAATGNAARHLRLRAEPDGVYLDIRSDEAACWEPIAGPVAAPAAGPVRLSYAGKGKAKLDGYAVP